MVRRHKDKKKEQKVKTMLYWGKMWEMCGNETFIPASSHVEKRSETMEFLRHSGGQLLSTSHPGELGSSWHKPHQ